MRRKRIFYICLVALFGFPIGYFTRGALETSRTDRAIALLNVYCVNFVRGLPYSPLEDLTPFRITPDETLWVEPRSMISVEIDNSSCGVSDKIKHFSPSERLEIEQRVEALVAEEFPTLPLDPNLSGLGWDMLRGWMQGPFASPERWGVTVGRWAKVGEDAFTTISISKPRATNAYHTNKKGRQTAALL